MKQSTDQPLVSVVMIIRDVDRFVAEAIESILDQTFRDFEFIIVDFGSIDKSKDIAARYAASDHRIALSEIPPSSYIEAKVAACSLAKGCYIAIQDADDVSLPSRLEAEVDFMEKHREVGVLGGAVEWIDSQGEFLKTAEQYPAEDHQIRSLLKERNPFWHPTVLIRTQAYVQVGGYRMAYTQSDDYDLWLRISEHYRCANLSQVVLKYRIHPKQLSLRKRQEQILCLLAAQASACLRAEGHPDPMNSVVQITPAVLAGMGVSEARQNKALAEGYLYWIKQIYAAGEHGAVLEAAAEMLRLCKGRAVARFVSEAHLMVGKTYWKQRRVFPGCLSFGRAVLVRPRVMGRALYPLLRRLGAM